MRPKIFVCQPVPPVAIDRLREYGDVEVFPFSNRAVSIAELESAARRSDYIFCMHETPITASMASANPNLKGFALSRPAPGIVDVGECHEIRKIIGGDLVRAAHSSNLRYITQHGHGRGKCHAVQPQEQGVGWPTIRSPTQVFAVFSMQSAR